MAHTDGLVVGCRALSGAEHTVWDWRLTGGMDERRLLRRCRTLVRDIPVPRPWAIDVFVRQLETSRGRPIHLHAVPQYAMADKPCGVWLQMDDQDHIFFEKQTSPLHQEHIILHELGHMIGGHTTTLADALMSAGDLFPDLSPTLLKRMFARVSYHDDQEQEAELIASLIRAAAGPGGQQPTDPVITGLAAQFGYRDHF
ncbi:hypothetical protein D5S17_21060 [Pseudonocardiaceae bacterium YIM PH 21723]|nr:hypothetical protein D5S17_21060 [Pseudonocardiaceae bacterium YIM PH 21723]